MKIPKAIGKLYIAIVTLLVIGGLQITSSIAQTPNTVRIEGIIKPIESNLQQVDIYFRTNSPRVKFEVDSNLRFSGDLSLEKPDYVEFTSRKCGFRSAKFYLKPGIKVKLEIIENTDRKWEVRFIGDGISDINSYLGKKAQIVEKIKRSKGKNIYQLNGSEFLKTANTIETQVEDLLKEMKLEPKFTNTEKQKLEEEKLQMLTRFSSNSEFVMSGAQLPENFDDGFIGYNLNTPLTPAKKAIVKKAFELQAIHLFKTKNITLFEAQRNIIEGIDYKETRNYMIRSLSEYTRYRLPSTKEHLKFIINNIDDKELANGVKTTYEIISSVKIDDSYSLLDSLKTINDEYVNLSDFKGKYVFLGLWSTWMEPIKKEMVYLRKLEKEYRNKNIVFVGLSKDGITNTERWKKLVKDLKPGGVQLMINRNKKEHTDFLAHIKKIGIYRFLLFDPNGKLIHSYAPKPSDEFLLKELFNTLDVNLVNF
ncbi:TlpA family protein disulfide reductase [Marinifilum sp.]|uniref:TlpA family protein disulfide reductase n=1 Tax=Marinifilum sp. TaxID=2033137 RepID=UPI003BAD69C1